MSQLCLKRVQKSRTIPSRGYEEIVQTPCLEMIAAGSRHHIWPSFNRLLAEVGIELRRLLTERNVGWFFCEPLVPNGGRGIHTPHRID